MIELLDNLVGKYAVKVEEKYPLKHYPAESKAGNELQDIFFEVHKITDQELSQAGIIARDSLLTRISAEKIRGFI